MLDSENSEDLTSGAYYAAKIMDFQPQLSWGGAEGDQYPVSDSRLFTILANSK